MAKTKYNEIYTALREKMEDGTYAFQELLPSENTLVKEFGCSRNTIRRAIGQLASEGYVQSIHGKGESFTSPDSSSRSSYWEA